jgi:hypothetical protein
VFCVNVPDNVPDRSIKLINEQLFLGTGYGELELYPIGVILLFRVCDIPFSVRI